MNVSSFSNNMNTGTGMTIELELDTTSRITLQDDLYNKDTMYTIVYNHVYNVQGVYTVTLCIDNSVTQTCRSFPDRIRAINKV